MAKISETSDDGSNGGDPNKKPTEKENQIENPQEEEENQNENPQEIENLPIPQHIPEELIEIIVAFVRRYHYPKLSLISRAFRRLIASPELYATRSGLGVTEPVLYASIGFPPLDFPSCYIFYRSKISLRLSRITSLPLMPRNCAVVTIGYNMYVMGGCVGLYQPVSTVIVIDCRFHTWHNLPNMKRARCLAAAGVIDGKIYVIGGCEKRYNNWVEVFDVENENWSTVPGQCPDRASVTAEFGTYVVMEDKIYILDRDCCLAYEPRQNQWETWGSGSQLKRFWQASSCVVDDLLYTIDPLCFLGHPIVVYDPNDRVWRPVTGLDDFHLPSLCYYGSKMVNFGGKLVVLGAYLKDIWCVEIALVKREGGEIRGNIEPVALVFRDLKSPSIDFCCTVTV